MSRTLRTVAVIAAGVALVATGVGAVAGGAVIGTTAAGGAATLGALTGSIATYAGLVAGVASVGAQVTAPKPRARGSITDVILAAEPPRPCLWGRTYFAGIVRHQVGYGATLKKVPNPYLWQVKAFSGVGPVEGLVQEQFDFEAIGSYYTGFYSSVSQLGLRPESTALVPPLSAPATGWGTSSKLSGCAAIGSNYKFDKDGERFANGLPNHGAIWDGAKVYDPRLDSTRAGGSGSHRIDDDTTWTYSKTPALAAGTYAYGWYESDILFYGIGAPDDAIDWAAIAAWANDCETNGWELSGVTFEGGDPADRIRNLDDICAAGGGRWITAGAVLSFDWHRPRVSLATITDDDILESGGEIIPLQSLRDRFNTVRPQYTSEAHNWELITADAIVGTTYKTEDGQELVQTYPLNLVADDEQAGELASYAMADSREIGPITLTLGPQWRFYKPGETLTFTSDILNFDRDVVILTKSLNPATLEVTFTFKTETAGKHTFALGQTATPPPTPVIGQSAQERDAVASAVIDPRGAYRVETYQPTFPVTPGDGEIDISAFTGVINDGRSISFPAFNDAALSVSTRYVIFWDLIEEEYVLSTAAQPTEWQSRQYAFVAAALTSDSGTFPTPADPPPGASTDPDYNIP